MLKLWRKKLPDAALSVIITALAVGVTVYSSEVVHGISEGIQVCISVVIPSLFAMMYLSVFAVECGMAERIGRMLAAPSRWLFGLPGEAGAAVLLSMIGGYPAGAKAVCGLYQRGAISARQARRMANFCFCSGPAFLIGTVGGVTGGMRSGLLLLAVQVITVPLMGVIMRLAVRGDDCDIIPARCNAATPAARGSISRSFVSAAQQTASAMLSVCLFVIIFSAVSSLLWRLGISEAVSDILIWLGVRESLAESAMQILLEVTQGCISAASAGLPAVAFAVGFGGLAVHMQVLSICAELGLRYGQFLLARLAQGIISAALTAFAMRLLPDIAVPTSVSVGIASGDTAGALSLLLMCAMCVMCMGSRETTLRE